MILNAFFYLFLVIGTALWALGIQVPTPALPSVYQLSQKRFGVSICKPQSD